MTEKASSKDLDPNSVRKVMSVKAPTEVAWCVFTEKIGNLVAAGRLQDRQGQGGRRNHGTASGRSLVRARRGRQHDRLGHGAGMGADGSPGAFLGHHRRLAVRPQLEDGDRAALHSSGKNTRVELEHRRLDRYGARRDEMRAIFETQGDWGKLLERFARVAET